MLSADPSALRAGTQVRARLRAYAAEVGEIVAVVPGVGVEPEPNGPLTVLGSGTRWRPTLLADYAATARSIGGEPFSLITTQDPFESGVAGLILSRRLRVPLHVQVHTDITNPAFAASSLANRIRLLLADLVLPNASAIRVVSQRAAEGLAQRYGTRIQKVAVLPIPPIDLRALPPTTRYRMPFPFSVLAVGRLEKEKSFHTALYALKKLRARHPGAGLVIAGAGRERERLGVLAQRLGIAESVVFLGWRDDVRALMEDAHALLATGSFEGYGMLFVEAALASLPIVTTPVGIVGELFIPGTHVRTFPVGDAARAADELALLMNDIPAREVMVRKAQDRAHAHLAEFANYPARFAQDLSRAVS